MGVWMFSVCLALMVACAHDSGGGAEVSPGREFKLKAGGEARVKGAPVKVRFASVAEDSRCPRGVDCVWAGNARVSLVVEAAGRATSVELNTNVEPKAASAEGYELALVDLSPYPRADEKINPKDYAATLVVRRK